MKSIFRKWNQWFGIRNEAEAVAAASFSVCMTALVLYGIKDVLYGEVPLYDQLVTGGCTYLGYNKQGDMDLFYGILLLVPILYLLCLAIVHGIKDYLLDMHAVDSNDNYVNKKCIFEKFFHFIADSHNRCAEVGYAILSDIIVFVFACIAVTSFVASMRPMQQDLCNKARWGMTLAVILLYGILRLCRKSSQWMTKLSHLVLPFCFLSFYKFYYAYEGQAGLIQLFYSTKWKLFCFVCFALFAGWQLICLFCHKAPSMVASTMLVGVMTVAKMPEGILSVDFFHNGEMAFPMQQLMSHGKVPYVDMDPIHGFCDYLYSVCNYAFFDGTYFSQNAAIFVANIFVAAFLAFVISNCLERKDKALCLVTLFMPFFVELAGVRYVIFFAAFFVLLSSRVRKNAFVFIVWYGLFCMAGIAYNVSIGSSMAVGFLPIALYLLVTQMIPELMALKEWDRDTKRKRIVAYVFLAILVACYMPLFLQIIRFLRENAGTTTYVNGTPVFGEEFKAFETFAWVVPYVLMLGNALKGLHNPDEKEHVVGPTGKLCVATASCLLVIVNYACVRYDEALRLIVLAVVFSLLYLCYSRRYNRFLVLAVALYLCRHHLVDITSSMMQIEAVPVQMEIELIKDEPVDDAVVFVSGESVGMPNLGTGFIQGTTLTSLQNIQAVLDHEQAYDSYLDLTNRISHYVIFDATCDIPFTSAYNISNDLMQQKAIQWIKEAQPKLILLSPYIQFDQATTSLRSILFFDQIMNMGYEAYTYGDVTYLLMGESQFNEAVDGSRMLGLLCHRTDLGMLPYEWAGAIENYDYEVKTIAYRDFVAGCATEQEDQEQKSQENENTENKVDDIKYIMLTITDEDIQTVAAPFDVDDELALPERLTYTFISDIDGENHSFEFETGWDTNKSYEDNLNHLGREERIIRYLIPVCSSPFYN